VVPCLLSALTSYWHAVLAPHDVTCSSCCALRLLAPRTRSLSPAQADSDAPRSESHPSCPTGNTTPPGSVATLQPPPTGNIGISSVPTQLLALTTAPCVMIAMPVCSRHSQHEAPCCPLEILQVEPRFGATQWVVRLLRWQRLGGLATQHPNNAGSCQSRFSAAGLEPDGKLQTRRPTSDSESDSDQVETDSEYWVP
jgi:hypothetical protein